MAYNYLDPKHLKDALHDSEQYMEPFYEPLAELERITRGKPGRVAPGKPKVTTGKLASIRRELSKQVVQQLPTGRVTLRDSPDFEDYASAILTDIILPNANSGGTPYAKSKNAIKDVFSIGSSWAHPFYNRRGELSHADFRRVYVKDILFEKGKVSEFDSNYMWMIGWYTETDLKAIIYWQQQLKRRAEERGDAYEDKWNLKALQELIDSGAKPKNDDSKSEAERKLSQDTGYFRIAHAFQIGKEATFYSYAPAIDKVVKECKTTDPRGIIPLHGLVPEEDYANPIGEAIAAVSVPKQNLADFDMQNYQYHQGLGTDPAVKLWGSTPAGRVQLKPGHIIKMNGTPATDDFQVVDIRNQAIQNFSNNYALLASEIMEETGFIGGSNVSAEAGNPTMSKTQAGVKQTDRRTGLSLNDLQKQHEQWLGRIYETMLVLQLSESHGEKQLELSHATMQRLKLKDKPTFDYDRDYGPVQFEVQAGTEQAADNEAENEKLVSLLELKLKHGAQPDSKYMRLFNQIVQNAGVDDPENIQYTDDEIELATEMEAAARQQQQVQLQAANNPQPQPQQPSPALPVAPLPSIEEDRALAMQQLIDNGLAPEQADLALQAVDRGEL